MSQQEFDELVQEVSGTDAPQAPRNRYDDLIAEEQDRLGTTIRVAGRRASQIGPQRAADALTLGRQLGTPPSFTERNYDQLRPQQPDAPYAAIQRESPRTAAFLADPIKAAVAQDDLASLGFFEWLTEGPKRAYRVGQAQARYGELKFRSQWGDLPPEDRAEMGRLRKEMRETPPESQWFRKAVAFVPNQLPRWWGAFFEGSKHAAYMAPVGAGVGALAAPAAGLTVPLGFAAGATAGFAGGGWNYIMRTAGGLAAEELEQITDEHGHPLDPNIIKVAALTSGFLEGGLEMLQVATLGQSGGVALTGRQAVKAVLKKPTVRAALGKLVKDYGVTLTEEASIEVAQRGAAIIVEESAKQVENLRRTMAADEPAVQLAPDQEREFHGWYAKHAKAQGLDPNPDAPSHFYDYRAAFQAGAKPDESGHWPSEFKRLGHPNLIIDGVDTRTGKPIQTLEGRPWMGERGILPDLMNTGVDALQSFLLLSLPGPSFKAGRRIMQARQARHNEAFFQALGEGALNSKTMERAPEVVQQLIAETTKDGPIERVGVAVETWNTYWQQQGVDPAQMAEEVLGTPAPYRDAMASKTDLTMPLSVYTVKLAGTKHNSFFRSELRFDSMDRNAREASELAAIVDRIATTAERAETAEPDSAVAVRALILDQLQSLSISNRFSPALLDAVAALHEHVFRVFGEKAGMDPLALFKLAGLQIVGPGLPLQEAQAAPGTTTVEAEGQAAPPPEIVAGGQRVVVGGPVEDQPGLALAAPGEENVPGDTEAGQPRQGPRVEGVAAGTRVAASVGPERESDTAQAARRQAHYDAVFAAVAANAQALDPTVDVPALRAEFDQRLQLLEELEATDTTVQARALLEAIARRGGLSLEAEAGGGLTGELRWLRESAMGPFGSFQGVAGVFRTRLMDTEGQPMTGRSVDDMATSLAQDPQFGVTSPDDLLAALEAIARRADPLRRGRTFLGSRELARAIGVRPDAAWWAQPAAVDEAVTDAVEPAGEVDTTFDVLDTGEQQARLPGEAGAVREEDRAQPEFEALFSLTSEMAQRRGVQRTLFQRTDPRARLRSLEAGSRPGTRRVPFPVAGKALASQVYRATAWDAGAIVDIPLADIVMTQEDVQTAIVEGYLGKTDTRPTRVPTAAQVKRQKGGEWPLAHVHEGRYYLSDGTHRVTAAWAEGKSTIPGVVYPVDAARVEAPKRPPTFLESLGALSFEQRQELDRVLGAITFKDGRTIIELFQGANASTLLHESAHLFFNLLLKLEATVPAVKADVDLLRTRYGVTEFGTTEWERFAREFEAYLQAGKAPTPELRGIFRTFRNWMMRVYRTLADLSRAAGMELKLDEEITGLFDRLVASESALARARAEHQVRPLFTTAEAAGMTTEEFDRYRTTVTDASEREMAELSARLLREWKREETAWWREAKAEITAEVRAEHGGLPIYRLLAAVYYGTTAEGAPLAGEPGPMKLSRDVLVQRYGEGILKRLPPRRVYVAAGGYHPDLLAPIVGYGSGDELVLALTQRPKSYGGAVRDEVARRMVEKYGDATTQPRLDEAAEAIVNGGMRVRVIQAELRALTRELAQGVIPSREELQRIARERVGRTLMRDVRPGLYLMAAQRASARATRLLAEQSDRQAAIEAKRDELVNLALYREAVAAKDRAETIRAYMVRLTEKRAQARLGKIGGEYLAIIRGLLQQFEFSVRTLRALDRREDLRKWIEGRERATGIPLNLPASLVADARLINWRELTVDELRDLYDGVRQLMHHAGLKGKLLDREERRRFKAVTAEIATSVVVNGPKQKVPPHETRLPGTEWKRVIKGNLMSMRNIAGLGRELDGFQDGGAFFRHVTRRVKQAGDAKVEMMSDASKTLTALVSSYRRAVGSLFTRQYIAATGKSWTRIGRVAVALNWGNEGNRQRIRDGYGLADHQVQAILDTLTDADLDFVEGVFAYVESFWPLIVAKQERVEGIAPEKVLADAFTVRGRRIAGGYYPLKYDTRQAPGPGEALDREFEEGTLHRLASYVGATTNRGHLEARAERVVAPVRLDLGPLMEHVEQVVHDLTHHEMLIDVGRILADRGVARAMYGALTDIGYQEFKLALRDIAVGDIGGTRWWEKSMAHMRTGATVAALGWNATTALLQPLGFVQAIPRVGARWIGQGMVRFFRGGPVGMVRQVRWVAAQSTFMRHRSQTMTQELNEVYERLGIRSGKLAGWLDEILARTTHDLVTRQAIADSFFWGIQKAQMVADHIVWLGQYEKSRAADMDHSLAVEVADQTVLDTQGGGQVKDLAGPQRAGPFVRSFAMFSTYYMATWAQTVEVTKRTNFRNPVEIARLGVDYLLLYPVQAAMVLFLRRALRGDEDEPDSWIARLAKESLVFAMGPFMFVRELESAVQGYDYKGPAGTRLLESMSRLYEQTEQVWRAAREGEDVADTLDPAFWRALNESAGILFHYPAGMVRRSVEGFAAMQEGEAGPRAVIFGPPRQEP